jgi:hypothetical protein
MSITLRDLRAFEPQLSKPEYGPEPTLHALAVHYYRSHGITEWKAGELADEYLRALKTHLNTARRMV